MIWDRKRFVLFAPLLTFSGYSGELSSDEKHCLSHLFYFDSVHQCLSRRWFHDVNERMAFCHTLHHSCHKANISRYLGSHEPHNVI